MLDDHELTEITDEQFREESGAARALLTSTFSAWTEAHEQTRTEEPELLLIAVTPSNKGEDLHLTEVKKAVRLSSRPLTSTSPRTCSLK